MIHFKPLTFADVRITPTSRDSFIETVYTMRYKSLSTGIQDNHGSRVLGLNRLNKLVREIIADRVIDPGNEYGLCEVHRV